MKHSCRREPLPDSVRSSGTIPTGTISLVPPGEPGTKLQVRGIVKYARLFAYVKTDAQGRYEMRTIRPASYPNTDLPQHIHVHIDGPHGRHEALVTEILFDDDPRLTKSVRAEFERGGNIVCPVKREPNGVHSVVADFLVR